MEHQYQLCHHPCLFGLSSWVAAVVAAAVAVAADAAVASVAPSQHALAGHQEEPTDTHSTPGHEDRCQPKRAVEDRMDSAAVVKQRGSLGEAAETKESAAAAA